MSGFDWLPEFLDRLQREHVLAREDAQGYVGPARLLDVDAEDWGRCARIAALGGLRWAGVWGDQRHEELVLTCCLVQGGDYLLLRTRLALARPVLSSHTPHYPGADRPERHLQDMYGVAFLDHPDARRWTRHQAWTDAQYPLRTEFAEGEPPQLGVATEYVFSQTQGAGVCEIPVGPVHAGIIEPGHFRFQAVGEEVLHLEERLGYVHKGIEKAAVGRDAFGLARLAGRVSGDSTVAHTWAACAAMEAAVGVVPPPRALALRALLAERERVANHLGDIGAICSDVSFAFGQYQFSRLRELWQRDSAATFGHRFMMDVVVPGGVTCDLDEAKVRRQAAAIAALRGELVALLDVLQDYPSLDERLVNTGVLRPAAARRLGVLGYVARASGQDIDVRRDHRYAPYDRFVPRVPVFDGGDIEMRMRLRAEETLAALQLMDALLAALPDGAISVPWATPAQDAEGFAVVEAWRGELFAYVRFTATGRVARYFPRDPSWFLWPALEQLIHGNIVPDFPVCNKSVNASYSGHDL